MGLSNKNIKTLGSQINSIILRLELMQLVSDALILAENSGADSQALKQNMSDTLCTISDQAKQLQKELDIIACKLTNCDNDEELEAIRKYCE
jgi:hypothetical protein